MNNIKILIKELKDEKIYAEAAVQQFKDVNDEYHGFYKGKVEAYILLIQKLDLLLNSENEKQR